ncbi:hypothetical protein [Microbacterium sp.]|jgi:hypothetical protein
MADQQSPQTQTPALTAPPSLQLMTADAEAGLCTDGYCVLPQPRPSE